MNSNNKQTLKKEEFRYLFKIKFNNKVFRILFNQDLGIYPIEILNGKPKYPEYEDYIGIYNIFTRNLENSRILYSAISKNNTTYNKQSGIAETKTIKIKPLVYSKLGLISIMTALIMSGCAIQFEKTEVNNYAENIEDVQDDDYIKKCIQYAEKNGLKRLLKKF